VAPFVMAAINTRNVHRSNFLLGQAYGADFVYDEMLVTGAGEKGQAMAKAVARTSPGLGRAPSPAKALARGARGRLLRPAVPGEDAAGHRLRWASRATATGLRLDLEDDQRGRRLPAATRRHPGGIWTRRRHGPGPDRAPAGARRS
jgi:hypothetical protein